MNILVINSGSSSIKYQLVQMPEEKIICSGMVERIGLDNAQIHIKQPLIKQKMLLKCLIIKLDLKR